MPTIKGNLMFVSSRAAHVTEVWVRAPKVRTHVEGVVTTGNDRFPVVDGEVSFTAVPGPAVLALISQGRAVDTIPILVSDAPIQSLETAILAAEVADDAQRDILEGLAAQVAQDAEVARAQRVAAEDAASTATSAAGEAAQSKDAAATSEMNAAQSEADAAGFAELAEQYKTAAGVHELNAARSETNAAQSESSAAASEQAASTSASKAATSEANAQDSATAAATSATEAAAHADRAEQAADPDGLRDEITQQLADLVDGAPEDLDTIREVAEYAQENRDITDALNAAIGNKANKAHTHTTVQVDGLDAALAGKADAVHTHTLADIEDAGSLASKQYVDALIVEGDTGAMDGKLHIVYE